MKEFVFLLFLTAASFSDIRFHKIDNALNLAGGLAGAIFLLSTGDVGIMVDGLYAAGLVFICLLLLFILRLIGAGDIKFLMAASLFTGSAVLFSSIPYMLSSAILLTFPRILKQRSFLNITFPAAVPISAGLLCGMCI
ncbi:MAG: prepilin peptidase [Lachnospiraceae bacterium]|nr:prepilin peptidase [Lachnospiraceae bacterium]